MVWTDDIHKGVLAVFGRSPEDEHTECFMLLDIPPAIRKSFPRLKAEAIFLHYVECVIDDHDYERS